MNTLPNIQDIQKTVSVLGSRYGAERIYLFGSYARGDAEENSDIDLRIDKGAIRGLTMGYLLVDLEDALGKKVDLISTKCLRTDFLASIKDEEILLYEK
ncbi:MAG: nucleotidyltransferase [Lachnospiraceae bacterium]|nr:nucleotidyltransferase [Lachnospiraceae bacterium]